LADIQKNNDGTRGILMDIPQLNGGLPRRQPERPLPSLGGEVEPLDFGGVTMGDPKKLGKARPPNWQMKEMNMALSNKLGVDYWDLNSRALGF
jgi:hypothetical protein